MKNSREVAKSRREGILNSQFRLFSRRLCEAGAGFHREWGGVIDYCADVGFVPSIAASSTSNSTA